MNIWYGSDLHTEFWPKGMTIMDLIPNPNDIDLFIFPGDIAEWVPGRAQNNNAIKDVIQPLINLGKQSVIVPGNHEFYFSDYDEVNLDMHDYFNNVPEVQFLQSGQLFQIPGVIDIIGGTLWTDVFKGNILAGKFMQSRMNDRQNITRGFRKFSYKDFIAEHNIMLKSIENIFNSNALQGSTVPKMIVSHHAPSFKSLHPDYINGDPESLDNRTRYINAGYASNLDDFIKKYDIDFWLHGHIHYKHDYILNGTRILCNPFGYVNTPGEKINKKFHEGIIQL